MQFNYSVSLSSASTEALGLCHLPVWWDKDHAAQEWYVLTLCVLITQSQSQESQRGSRWQAVLGASLSLLQGARDPLVLTMWSSLSCRLEWPSSSHERKQWLKDEPLYGVSLTSTSNVSASLTLVNINTISRHKSKALSEMFPAVQLLHRCQMLRHHSSQIFPQTGYSRYPDTRTSTDCMYGNVISHTSFLNTCLPKANHWWYWNPYEGLGDCMKDWGKR